MHIDETLLICWKDLQNLYNKKTQASKQQNSFESFEPFSLNGFLQQNKK